MCVVWWVKRVGIPLWQRCFTLPSKIFQMSSEASKAVEALVAASRKDKHLEGSVYVQIALKSSAVDERQSHPMLIPLPHRFKRKDENLTCLVVKDPSHPIATAIDQNELTNQLFDEIIGVGKLRRRVAGGTRTHDGSAGKTTKKVEEFAKAFPIICVQDKVAEPLTELMGLGYLKRGKHLPIKVSIPANITPEVLKNLRFVVKASQKCTQLILRPDAKISSVKVGHTKMDSKKLAENVEAVIREAQKRIPKGLGLSAQFYVKTPESLALKVE